MNSKQIRTKAREFAVWRAIRRSDGQCSFLQIERETGVHHETARAICKRRGWLLDNEVTIHEARSEGMVRFWHELPAVDQVMSTNHAMMEFHGEE